MLGAKHDHSANPYLNFDPNYVSPTLVKIMRIYGAKISGSTVVDVGKNIEKSADSQYILPEGASKIRGRFELAFSHIGGAVFVGAGIGGFNGVYKGLKFVQADKLTGTVMRTQMLNFITKHGASSAQSFGVLALMYSVFGVLLSKARGADDELNTLASGLFTGLAYKSSAGWKRCLRSGGIGIGLAAAYVMIDRKDRVKEIVQQLRS